MWVESQLSSRISPFTHSSSPLENRGSFRGPGSFQQDTNRGSWVQLINKLLLGDHRICCGRTAPTLTHYSYELGPSANFSYTECVGLIGDVRLQGIYKVQVW